MTPSKSNTQKPARGEATETFTEEELAAMKDYVKEQKAHRATRGQPVDEEPTVLEKIAEMVEPDRSMAERVHQIIKASAPDLAPRLWYGMPAYAKDGKVICFFQPAQKFKARYSTLGFNDGAALDDGVLWPVAYALTELTPAAEERIAALVKKAAE